MEVVTHSKIAASHLSRQAIVYLRQSSPKQVRENLDSQLCQRTLIERAKGLGWHEERVKVLEGDLGKSASQAQCRDDFKALAAAVALGHVGIVFGWDVSRLARNNADWYQLLDLAALFDTLIGDHDGIYDPKSYNDRLLLGLKGTMSEAELYSLRQRLNAGRLSKVKRGEYVQHLPTGLRRLSHGKVVKDPDAQVRQVIELLFTKFEQLGSGQKVLHYCRDQGILLPRHQTSGFQKGELLWKKPSESAIRSILKNPAYAGAFVYGRRVKEANRQKPGRHSTGCVRKPLEDWVCIIHDLYPAYISWEQYLANQAKLQENRQQYNDKPKGGRGAPGKGAALLQGLATCGHCGRRMTVSYKPGVRYVCKAMSTCFAEPMCAHLDGPSIEKWVVHSFFEAIKPAQLDALELLLKQQKDEYTKLQKYHQQQIERAEYEVGLARRRYQQVDPDNRLVADELEKEWEEQLRHLKEAQEAADCFSQSTPQSQVTPQLRQQLAQLNRTLPELWETQQLSNEQKKQLLRSLISKVILQRTAPDQVQIKIVWVSGHFSEGNVVPPIWKQVQASNYSEIVDCVKSLWQQKQTDAYIAKVLNEEGFRTARQKDFTAHSVTQLRHREKLKSPFQEHRGAHKVDGLWTTRGLATHLGVDVSWVYNRIRNGVIGESDLTRRPQGYLLLRDDESLMERLRQEVQRTRKVRSH